MDEVPPHLIDRDIVAIRVRVCGLGALRDLRFWSDSGGGDDDALSALGQEDVAERRWEVGIRTWSDSAEERC